MKWTEDLSVGIEAIDTQHKALIKAVNDLFDACSHGKGRAQISQTMDFMVDYTNFHFGDEEKLMIKYNYPELAKQKKAHTGFVKQVLEYKDKIKSQGADIALVAQFNSFITNWLIYHISKEDKRIGEFINKADKN